MPEGDTIWRTARTLHAALAGKTVLALESSLVAVAVASRRLGVVGRRLEAVEARGKHLIVRFAGGAVLHTHMGMRGSWRLHRRTGAGRVAFSRARAVIETSDVVAVCTQAPVVEMLSPSQASAHPALARLGPDLLGPAFDSAAARRRLRERGDLRDLDDATIDRLVAKAAPACRAESAARQSTARCRASRPARRTSARPASAESYFPRNAATVPSTPAGGCSRAKRSSSCSSVRRRASVAFSSAVIAS